MVSLTAAEGLAASLWPEDHHAVVFVPDPRKGERLILVTHAYRCRYERAAGVRAGAGVPEIMVRPGFVAGGDDAAAAGGEG